jgi:hypothetical protein
MITLVFLLISSSAIAVNAAIFTDSPRSHLVKTDPVNLTILGAPLATKEQCVQFLKKRNALPLLTVSIEQLVDYYYSEGMAEGVRPDVAFAQAIHETGYFRYGGDVNPLQNNYCGLGTTGGRVKGHSFEHSQLGVRAQIQHLLAYASTEPPKQDIVDPRYNYVKSSLRFGQARTWTDLNGRWAVPGRTYGQMILRIHQQMLEEKT